MPRLVDHEQRRREITDAVRRVIVAGGLQAATFQSVAAEAGISVRLVQYYFGNKREFLLATHRAVVEDGGARFARALEGLGAGASPRDTVRAVLTALLPLDAERRAETIVLGAFNQAAMSGQGITIEEQAGAPKFLVAMISAQLERARALDATLDVDPELDGELALAAMGGLTQGMAAGYGGPELAVALVDRLLDRLFGTTAG
ncbi:TetR/AcrR family transcriptional regulator [Nocardia uniformis]|uniref:TetR/AcrR family transcriptional regulator n=1 Tax=Nocardia uniformis TaxID=53432 RepID=A0A849BZR5_9NOCA|nr:TetR/AcrR family transcriptional regulator [Nocardia uniformis]NNH70656.1 TetR/AcrR family transcriptional regulator [Nocardia uniformis]